MIVPLMLILLLTDYLKAICLQFLYTVTRPEMNLNQYMFEILENFLFVFMYFCVI